MTSRRSTHHFDNLEEAIQYRDAEGTGGWIFVCGDKGEATIFPYQMTPTEIFNKGITSSSGGQFIGTNGRIMHKEEAA
jgi:hypothetical protein